MLKIMSLHCVQYLFSHPYLIYFLVVSLCSITLYAHREKTESCAVYWNKKWLHFNYRNILLFHSQQFDRGVVPNRPKDDHHRQWRPGSWLAAQMKAVQCQAPLLQNKSHPFASFCHGQGAAAYSVSLCVKQPWQIILSCPVAIVDDCVRVASEALCTQEFVSWRFNLPS